MADPNNKSTGNFPGRYYVDDTCTDCDMCRETAPEVFRRNDEHAASYVYQQPLNDEIIERVEDALAHCPSESIGNDGGS